MFDRLGATVARFWLPVILAWLVLAAVLHWVAPRWDDVTHDGDLAYLPASLPSVAGAELLARAFPNQKAKSELGIIVERADGPLSAVDLNWSDSLAVKFRERQDDLPILDVWNRNTEIVGDKLLSKVTPRGQAAITIVQLGNEFMAVGNLPLLDEVDQMLNEARRNAPEGLEVRITGSAAIGTDMLRAPPKAFAIPSGRPWRWWS